MGGAARDDDLADSERARLRLVELQRGDELPRERVDLAHGGVAGRGEVLGRDPPGAGPSSSERRRLIGSASEGVTSRARAMAMLRFCPPHSSTRVNSHTRPSETAKVERSWPTATATTATLSVSSSRG